MEVTQLTMSKEEAAKAIGVSRPTVDRLIRTDKTFPAIRIGRRVLISVAGLAKWIEKQASAKNCLLAK